MNENKSQVIANMKIAVILIGKTAMSKILTMDAITATSNITKNAASKNKNTAIGIAAIPIAVEDKNFICFQLILCFARG